MTVAAELSEDRHDVLEKTARKRRRLIPRFRLRTLFVAAVLMSLLLGWYGRHVYRVRQERAAGEALRRVGAELTMPTFDYGGMTLPADLYGLLPWFYVEEHTSVTLDSAKGATDEDIQHLVLLRGLKSLSLKGDGFTDEALRKVRHPNSIEALSLRGTSITASGLAKFEGRLQLTSLRIEWRTASESAGVVARIDAFPNLRSLDVNGEPLTVEGLRATAKLPDLRRLAMNDSPRLESGAFEELSQAPKLEELELAGYPPLLIGDEEFAAICRIKSLRKLVLRAPQLTDAGFAAVSGLPDLRELYVVGCWNLTDRAAKALAEIETLEYVSLLNYSVTEALLPSLGVLPNLKEVYLPPGISREAVQRFADEYPQRSVWHPHPEFPSMRVRPSTDVEGG